MSNIAMAPQQLAALRESSPIDPPLTPEQISEAAFRAAKESYIHRALVSFDDFVSGLIGTINDQTVSSQTEIEAHRNVWFHSFAVALNDGLDLIQKSHGQLAQVGDVVRDEKDLARNESALASETGLSESQVESSINIAEK